MKVVKVSFREDEAGNKYPFLDFGSETHGRISFRLWVSGRLLEKDEEGNYVITFPKRNAKIEKTEKGNLVLRPSDNTMVYNLLVRCGYRGSSKYEILSEHGDVFEYEIYHSPRGKLGISKGALVNTPNDKPLKYRWEITGRTYGRPDNGITIVMPNGEEKEFEEVPDGIESLNELPKL
jgi:hypothetical protein